MTFLGAASMSASGRHSEAIVMAIRWPLLVRRTHKWLALVVGVQALLWTLTGFYMVVVHIDTIHGDHLVHAPAARSEEHTSELQSLMRISYAVFCLKKKKYN